VEAAVWLLAVLVIVAHLAVLARLARVSERQADTSRRLFEMSQRPVRAGAHAVRIDGAPGGELGFLPCPAGETIRLLMESERFLLPRGEE
jgi:hypothetical protein